MSTTNTSSYLEERIDLLTKELASKRRATNWASNLSLILGLIVILLLCGYFGYGYYMFNDITNPKTVVASAKSYLDDLSIEARQTAGEEVKKSAPIWAQQASVELVANMPTLREKAEVAIGQYFDDQVQQSQDIARREFTRLIEENRKDFDEAIKIISEEGKSEEFVSKVMPLIEKQSGNDIQTQVTNVLGGLEFINEQLAKLSRGQDLNPIGPVNNFVSDH